MTNDFTSEAMTIVQSLIATLSVDASMLRFDLRKQ